MSSEASVFCTHSIVLFYNRLGMYNIVSTVGDAYSTCNFKQGAVWGKKLGSVKLQYYYSYSRTF